MSGWLDAALILTGLAYLGVPAATSFVRVKGYPETRTLTEADLPPELTHYLYSTAAGLREDGFRSEAYLSLPDPAPNVKTFLILMTNREIGDLAMVTVIIHGKGSMNKVIPYVEFETRFASGLVYDTLNSAEPISISHPGVIRTQLWDIQDPHRLYQIHRHILTRFCPPEPGDIPEMFEEGMASNYLREDILGCHRKEVERGVLRPIDTGEAVVFAPTLYGAFDISYRRLPPFAGLLRGRILNHARAVLRSFEAAEGT